MTQWHSKGGDGGRLPGGTFRGVVKLELYLKICEREKYSEAGDKNFMGGGGRLLREWRELLTVRKIKGCQKFMGQ